jgi:acetyl esterase
VTPDVAVASRRRHRLQGAAVPDLAALPLRAAVSVLQRLPDPVLRALAGRPGGIRLDGQTLAADVQLTLGLLRLLGHRGLDGLTVEEARAEIRRTARLARGLAEPVARVEPRQIPGPAGSIPARLYVPLGPPRARPLVVFYHGGGWVVGDLDTHDGVCRFLAREVDACVLAVGYRLAPEDRFPAAVDDAVAAFRWAVAQAPALGCLPARVAVAGDSAGGNLSAVVSLAATRAGGVRPAAQLLVYPVTDLVHRHPSYRLFAEGFFLTAAEMAWYIGHYLPDPDAGREPTASPLLAPDLRGLPPAVVLTAGFDPLRDEGEAYAARLEAAGVRVRLRRSAGLVHGFANTTSVSRTGRAAMVEGAHLLRTALDAA